MRRYHAMGGSFAREVKAEARPKRGKGKGGREWSRFSSRGR